MAIDDRLLVVLQSMNQIGPCTVLELHRKTGIPRAALYRILESLQRNDYVQRIPDSSRSRLTSKVLTLSAGYRDDDNIVEAGTKPLERLQQQVLWPGSISTPRGNRMIVRETTRYRSPFVFDTGSVGLSLPILESSMGRAYLAFCDPKARQIMLEILRHSADDDDQLARNGARVHHLLSRTVKQGYGHRNGGLEPKTSSIAVPILVEGVAVGSICVTYATSALTRQQAVEDFLPPLKQAAKEIAANLRPSTC